MIIALDCDNVLLDFLARWEQALKSVIERPVIENKRFYDLPRKYGLTRYEHDKCWNHFQHGDIWESFKALDGADEASRVLSEQGHEVHIVTSINPEFKKNRIINLDKHNIVYDDIHCVGQQQNKTELYRKINADIVIDDYYAHIKEAFLLGIEHRILIKTGLITSDEAVYSTRIYATLLNAAKDNLGLVEPMLHRKIG